MQFKHFPRLLTHGFVFALLLSLFSASPALRAQQAAQDSAQDSHLVSPDQLQQQMQFSTADRQKNIDNLTQFLSTPNAEQAMKSARVDPERVKTAIPTLSDAELADLSARATHAQQDFSAGMLGTGFLLLIILVIVVIILVAALH